MQIDKIEFEELCENQTTKQELIAYYATTKEELDTFCNTNYNLNFNKTYMHFVAKGKIKLRKLIMKIAQDNESHITKNQALMIMFLSKTLLDLKEDNTIASNNISAQSNIKNQDNPSSLALELAENDL